ncbi:hypothetical protein ANCCEY_15173 [Ancylostoma ceylanicum]|uniref:Uncharacterized protein n=1 Tax=Ancylostoma ceylanicum TaxID=53326 RepID=A0A0D6L4B4_9BILA|nr:hypothetical protein ANCCEY_15173 [Ancylostoma ceylanicum]
MDQLTAFYELKQLVLLRYREEYPYVSPEWKTFSSKDILQLIESIETETKQRISEKWIYTHLKPEVNEKLPRKDMLDILTSYCHMDSWNAFVYSLNKPVLSDGVSEDGTIPEPIQPKSTNRWLFVLIGMFAVTIGNNLGIEYMNKEEFTQKLTIPTTGVKRWQIYVGWLRSVLRMDGYDFLPAFDLYC